MKPASQKTLNQLEQELKELEKLLSSRGWQILKEHLNNDIMSAAIQLSDGGGNMTIDQIHFRRGAIWAGRKLLEAPELVKQILTNELLMEKASQLSKEKLNEPRN